MNAKLCKKLRAVARRATVGMPERAYIGIMGRGELRDSVIALANDPRSTRGAYRGLKCEVADQSRRHD